MVINHNALVRGLVILASALHFIIAFCIEEWLKIKLSNEHAVWDLEDVRSIRNQHDSFHNR